MAEVSENNGDSSRGKIRATKRPTKIDMTPMVDLAFLLLTFFILTSSFNNAQVLELPMPDKDGPQSSLNHKNVLNLVLAANNKVYWWDGLDGKVTTTNYSRKGIRQVLLTHTQSNPNTTVLIKPKDDSKYENIVDVIDELTITNTQRYVIVDFTDEDRQRIEEK